eukprot:9774422-Alexandrium_andersonii.AAC.1
MVPGCARPEEGAIVRVQGLHARTPLTHKHTKEFFYPYWCRERSAHNGLTNNASCAHLEDDEQQHPRD